MVSTHRTVARNAAPVRLLDENTSIVDGDGILILTGDAVDHFQGGSKPGVGVDGAGASNAINDGQTLVVDLGETHLAGQVTVTIAQFNGSQAENGMWQTFDSNGIFLESGTFSGTDFPANGSLTDVSLNLANNFQYIAFTFSTEDVNSNQGYFVNSIDGLTTNVDSVVDTFGYQLVDGDGDLSPLVDDGLATTLSITQVIGDINTGEPPEVI